MATWRMGDAFIYVSADDLAISFEAFQALTFLDGISTSVEVSKGDGV
jgi:hypothetical protein